MEALLPSPASSEEMVSSAYYGHQLAAAWSATPLSSLPGFCSSHGNRGFNPETPSPDNSSSWESQLESDSPTRDAVRTVADLVPVKGPFVAAGIASSDVDPAAVVVSSTSAASGCSGSRDGVKPVPSHREKPPHLVARRNARERRRVQAVNNAFCRLRKCVPVENRAKRLSKVKTLHKAIEYIYALQDLLDQADEEAGAPAVAVPNMAEVEEIRKSEHSVMKQKGNEPPCDQQRWINLENVDRGTESYQGFVNFYEQFPTTYAT
ncbi:achaete-scute complex protein T4-like [Dermacentor albipictus]|uniref:achaete-scute complex protein T4-like n=1 Tax=Dermacentor albipictus TaxID=60249 RepID=UPI0031FD1C53